MHLNEHDRRVSFFSVGSVRSKAVTLTVKASDGTVVTAPGRSARASRRYLFDSDVDATYLRRAGKVSGGLDVAVDATGVPMPESEPYQYSVITDSALRFDAVLAGRKWLPARKLLLTARLTEEAGCAGAPGVFVDMTRPRESIAMAARHSVSAAELRRVPDESAASPWRRGSARRSTCRTSQSEARNRSSGSDQATR